MLKFSFSGLRKVRSYAWKAEIMGPQVLLDTFLRNPLRLTNWKMPSHLKVPKITKIVNFQIQMHWGMRSDTVEVEKRKILILVRSFNIKGLLKKVYYFIFNAITETIFFSWWLVMLVFGLWSWYIESFSVQKLQLWTWEPKNSIHCFHIQVRRKSWGPKKNNGICFAKKT